MYAGWGGLRGGLLFARAGACMACIGSTTPHPSRIHTPTHVHPLLRPLALQGLEGPEDIAAQHGEEHRGGQPRGQRLGQEGLPAGVARPALRQQARARHGGDEGPGVGVLF